MSSAIFGLHVLMMWSLSTAFAEKKPDRESFSSDTLMQCSILSGKIPPFEAKVS